MKRTFTKSALATAVIAGFLAGTAAHAEDAAQTTPDQTPPGAEKNSCKGKKNSCKGMAKPEHKKGGKDKNSCKGKNGCGEKDKGKGKH